MKDPVKFFAIFLQKRLFFTENALTSFIYQLKIILT